MSSVTNPLLLVLDTNVCLDLFVFRDARWPALLAGLQNGSLRAVTGSACRDEWLAVLHYTHLPITGESRPEMIAAFDQIITCANPELSPHIKLPICADPDDQKFMELARDCRATHLITKDKALLKCGKKVAAAGGFQIMTPELFLKNVEF